MNGQADIKMAAHGLEAWDMMSGEEFDLLITDIRMPGCTGIELLSKMKMQGIDTPALLLTGYADFDYAREGLRFGALDYLLKPVEKDKLIEAVTRGLAIRQELKQKKRAIREWKEIHREDAEETGDTPMNESIAKSIAYLQEHLNEENSVREVAQIVNLSPSYFSVLFKESTGFTYSEYLNKLRLRKSKQLLLTTDLDINLIADEVGYQSSSYFIRVFREAEGATPKQYRDRFWESKV